MGDNLLNKIIRFSQDHSFFRSISLCLVSAALLVLSFPRSDIWLFVWIGLVPFLFALEGKSAGKTFLLGYLLGIIFFAGTLYWIIHVTLPGLILLVLYLALYFAFFAVGYRFFSSSPVAVKLIVLPSLWVALEFIRGHFLTGFGWAGLCHTQYKNLALIQIADITGMLGISFLIVMVNVLIKEIIRVRFRFAAANRGILYAAAVAVIVISVVLKYGFYRLGEDPAGTKIRIAVVQGNIDQEIKWDRRHWPYIMRKYLRLTAKAAVENPDLIIWPESSFPGYLWEAPQLFEELKSFVGELKIPLLVGAVTQIGEDYHNSAFLISAQGEVIERYDKIHLVPFGEYIPSRKLFPFLEHLVPIADFTSGGEYTIFPAFPGRAAQADKEQTFSVLICFEDTVARIAREFSRRGTGLLINITNDAWFKDTSEPFMHLQNSVFRTIENRKGLVRSANTGISCFIDAYGRIYQVLSDLSGKITYVRGYTLSQAGFNQQESFYTKFGDVFTYLCFGCILLITIININTTRKRS